MEYTLKYELTNNRTEYAVSGYTGNPFDVEIPRYHEGKPVTSIGDSAFWDCSSLMGVVIPDSVTSIGSKAFSGCSSLIIVTIPDSVETIGSDAFYGCSGLTEITVSTGNANYKSIDGNLYTKDGKNLIQYAIGKGATSFTIPDGVTSIGDRAFEDCSSLTSVVIGDSVTSIGEYAFEDCSSLTSVVIPDSVTSIGSSAFWGCVGLRRVAIPDSVTTIGDGAFGRCGLTSIEIPNSVTTIGSSAFWTCTGLRSVVIPDSVTSIGSDAFYECESLTSVVIGNGVTSIGSQAFAYCYDLTSITLLAKTPANISSTTFPKDIKFYCYFSALQSYKTAPNWKAYADSFVADDLRLYFTMNAMASRSMASRISKAELKSIVSNSSSFEDFKSKIGELK